MMSNLLLKTIIWHSTREARGETKQLMDLRTLMLTSITSALALVVGLFWNDAIKSAIEKLVPQSQDVAAKFASAVIVTIIVVAVVYLLFHSQRIAEQQLKTITRTVTSKKKKMAQK